MSTRSWARSAAAGWKWSTGPATSGWAARRPQDAVGGVSADHADRFPFRTEAAAIARLQHPNIVQLYEVGEHDTGSGATRPYFTLEFVDGTNLDDRLAGRPLAARQAARGWRSWPEPSITPISKGSFTATSSRPTSY